MQRFSGFGLYAKLYLDTGMERQWRMPEPKAEYDVIIVGAGGHGLATAYYLAKEHGINNVAVVERGWLAAATRAVTRPSFVRTTCSTKVRLFMNTRLNFGKDYRRI